MPPLPPSSAPPAQAPPPPPPPAAPVGGGWGPPPWTPPPRRPDRFEIRAGGTPRLLAAALVVGVAFDVGTHNGLVTVSGAVLVALAVAALLCSGRVTGWSGRAALVLTVPLSLALVFRSSPWVVAPVGIAVVVLLLLGSSLAATDAPLATFPAVASRLVVAAGHVLRAPGMLRVERATEGDDATGGARPGRALALARGAAIAAPIVLVIGALLGAADPVFQSWFDPPRLLRHLLLGGTGAWGLLGLARAASAKEPSPALDPGPRLGTVEVVSVLGALCSLYAAFVAAQLVTLAGGAHHVLVTRGLTYAEYARSGFFQLLAAAALTLVVLLSLRACADRTRTPVVVLSEVVVALTLGVVVVAVRRLQLYESAYGLTMLRLASTVTAGWIGLVFVMLGVAIARRHSPGLWLAPAVVLSAVLVIGGWAVANPAAVVARTNVARAASGHSLDVAQAVSLGPDAVPTLVRSARTLGATDADAVLLTLCPRTPAAGRGAAYNRSRAHAAQALREACA